MYRHAEADSLQNDYAVIHKCVSKEKNFEKSQKTKENTKKTGSWESQTNEHSWASLNLNLMALNVNR